MEKGDLSNEISPRVYLAFEGTLARALPGVRTSLWHRVRGSRLADYELDVVATMHVWDIWNRLGVRFDAVTFEFEPDEVQALLDDNNVPVSTVYRFADRATFAQQLAHMPWVTHVVDHQQPLAYGGRAATFASLRR